MTVLADRTTVLHLRTHCAGLDSTSAQVRLAAQLGSVSLRPRGLPPAALLCVRSLEDPLPGTIRLDSMQLGPPAEWERAAEHALDRALRGAARPALGPVPAGAEAVLFADRAELLACLARDSLDGTAWTRWWWAAVVRGSGSESVAAAWLGEPAYVPAAFELLARTGHAAAFARSLRTHDSVEMAVRVARVFAAPELARALIEAGRIAAPAEPGVEAQRAAPRLRRRAGPPSREPVPKEAWVAIVPEADPPGLSAEQEILLAVSLMLSRAPARAREPLFARAVSRAIRIGTSSRVVLEPAPLPDEREEPKEAEAVARARRRRPAVPRVAEPIDPKRASDAGAPAHSTPRQRVEPASDAPTEASAAGRPTPAKPRLPGAPAQREKRVETGRRSRSPSTAPSRPQAPRAPIDASEQPRAGASRPSERATPQAPRARHGPPPVPNVQPSTRTGVATELGGLFFLLNVGLFLGLYGDFTTPEKPGIALDPWDFVSLAGATLLGVDASRDDPVWPLLAGLAGRSPQERPGRHFRPPSGWRIPVSWLEPFEAEGEWLWSAARGTLRLVHPAGFPVVAVPLRGRAPQVVLDRELRRYRVRPLLRRAPLPAESRVPLRRWVARLATYLAARIQLAMGDPDRAHAVDSLLRRHAKVFATETHVDVSLLLFSLPIEIRLAGLDRDPGWMPAAGRFVAFHFE